MESIFWSIPATSIIAILFILYLILRINSFSEGSERMVKIAQAVRIGSRAYLNRQLRAVAIFFGVVFIILLLLTFNRLLPEFVPYAFLTGGLFSALAGYIGMNVATNASSRTAEAARGSLNMALRVAFSAGSVMGIIVVALDLCRDQSRSRRRSG